MNPVVSDPRDLVAFSYTQAHRLLDVPVSTIRAWKRGQEYIYRGERRTFEGPIPSSHERGLSYFDLVETFVLRSLRVQHRYPLQYIRRALRTAWEEYGIRRLFLHADFRHGGKEFFLERYTHLASLSRGRQLNLKGVLEDYLERIEYGEDDLTRYFYPIPANRGPDSRKIVVINPFRSFGRPMIGRVSIRTATIYDRVDAGEAPGTIMTDYGLKPFEFDEALNFEAA